MAYCDIFCLRENELIFISSVYIKPVLIDGRVIESGQKFLRKICSESLESH